MLTSGKISYSEKRNIAEYENKAATVEFSFTFGDNDDPDTIADAIMQQCKARVHTALGIKSTIEIPVKSAKPPKATKTEPKPEAKKPEPKKVEEDPELFDDAAEVEEPKPAKVAKVGKVAKKTAEEIEDDDLYEDDAETEVEEAEDDPEAEAEEGITDDMLTDAVRARNKEINAPDRIKKLIDDVVGKVGSRVASIPADKRQTFLNRLKKIA